MGSLLKKKNIKTKQEGGKAEKEVMEQQANLVREVKKISLKGEENE